MTVFLS